jgi:TPR repeat protein
MDALSSQTEARRVFLGCENNPRALCFAGLLARSLGEIRRAADLADAFAQAWMAGQVGGEESFQWAEKSAAQGERDGFYYLGDCYRDGRGCEKSVERAKRNFLVAAELGNVFVMVCLSEFFDKDDPQRFVWLGRVAAESGESFSLLDELLDQMASSIPELDIQRSFL